jgi:hypothetical protein
MYCLLACCCPVVAVNMNRSSAREKYGIDGDSVSDQFLVFPGLKHE